MQSTRRLDVKATAQGPNDHLSWGLKFPVAGRGVPPSSRMSTTSTTTEPEGQRRGWWRWTGDEEARDGPSLLTDAGVGRLVASDADVGAARERRRQLALRRLTLVLALLMVWLWWRLVRGDPMDILSWRLPTFDPFLFMASLLLLTMVGTLLGATIGAGRSPHIMFRPEQIEVTLDDVKGVDAVKEDVVRSLNLFLAHRAFTEEMGGTPRRGLLFEGLPGTGKTHMAKAMAREAGVPFLFVSATSFQSMYYGATARKIRSYFRALRKAARRDGGAIGFIEEIDAIAMTREAWPPGPLRVTPILCCRSTRLSSDTPRAAGNAPATALHRQPDRGDQPFDHQ